MSKASAIQTAVWQEFSVETGSMPSTGQEVVGTTWHFGTTEMQNFLHGVSDRLNNDTPSYAFPWQTANYNACIQKDVVDLCEYIGENTTP